MTLEQIRETNVDVTEKPVLAIQSGHYGLRLATSRNDLDPVFKLRFNVFNLELDEGLSSAFASGRDRDRYDDQCDHLLVEDLRDGSVVGTYRMQDQRMAANGAGFYSANEFRVADMGEEILGNAVELGRACVAAEHRNTRVLFLLWKGLARYMLQRDLRYFFGCSSLTSRNPADGHSLYQILQKQGSVATDLNVRVCDDYQCPQRALEKDCAQPRVPKLMRMYLSYGARVVSEPALDRDFSTIDFLTLFDIESLDTSARKLFLGE